jgi:aminopeptidase N
VRAAAEFDILDVDLEPDFLSFARGWSMFGSVACEDADAGMLSRQALSDPDVINRYFAFRCAVVWGCVCSVKPPTLFLSLLYRAVANAEKVRIVQQLVSGDNAVSVSAEYVSLFSRLLFDDSITPSTRGLILSETEALSASHPTLAYRYWEQAAARKYMYDAVFRAHSSDILSLFKRLCDVNKPGPHLEQVAMAMCMCGFPIV